MLSPVVAAPSLIEQAYRQMLEAIADGTLAPGQRIQQAELANSLSVSRQPISHALHLLKQQGLMEDSGRRGSRVVPIDALRVLHLYQVRTLIDVLAAGLAARQVASGAAPPELLDRLAALVNDAARFDGSTPIADLLRADADFHRGLYTLSGNPVIAEMTGPLWRHLLRSMASLLRTPGYWERIWRQEYSAILRAIQGGNPEDAERAARRHAMAAGKRTAKYLVRAA